MMVMQKIGKMTTEVLGETSFYSIRLRVITISSLVLLLIFSPTVSVLQDRAFLEWRTTQLLLWDVTME